jgi:outer membrane protein TolC
MRKIGLLLGLVVFSIPLVGGCVERDRYTYEHIKAAHPVQDRARVAKEPELSLPDPAGPVSIEDAVRIALERNPDVDMAVARIRQSEAMIDEATAAFWPTVSVYGEYIQGDAPSSYLFKTIDQRLLPPDVNFNDPGWFENYEVGVRARWNLFHGGRDWLRRKMAETGLEIHQLDRQSVENALVESVIHAYFNVMAARDFVQIAKDAVGTVAEQKRVVEVRYKGGGALKSDLLSLAVRLAQARENLVRAQNNENLSLAALANLMGLNADTTIRLKDRENILVDFPENYQAGLKQALAHRPELKKVRRQVVKSQMALDAARSEYLPRLDGEFRYYLDDPDFDFETDRENWTAGVILNWDAFTGFSTKARVTQARGVLEEMLAADRKTTQSIQLEIKTVYLRLAEARARLEVAEAGVAQAEESLSLVKKEYEGGSATITRYLEAELARDRARIRARSAFYDREKAIASVARGIGYWVGYGERKKSSP